MASRQITQEQQPWLLENGDPKRLTKEARHGHGRSRTAHGMSATALRKKSDHTLVSRVRCAALRNFLVNIQEVILGTKLSILFPAIPAAIIAHYLGLGQSWVFILSLLGLTPLAERVSFLTEQIAVFTGPTVGGLLNATCGNITELIIAIFALKSNQIAVVNAASAELTAEPSLYLSRAASIVMLGAYFAYLIFQLWTHRQLFEAEEEGEEGENNSAEEEAVIGFWSAFAWLAGMTVFIALLSEYVVDTIQDASDSWGLSVSFLSIILLPIVGNAAEHAGAIIFAFKNKLDITLGVALGSATQIAMFAVPLCVTIAWIMGVKMDLNFNLLETGSLALAIIVTGFTLQDGTSHYMKGLVLLLCYLVIGACFFVQRSPIDPNDVPNNITLKSFTDSVLSA
ncbi:hypothetical protein TSUD_161380 [Trifolium subterraneum]|uniref:Sodium/calcium exchanger membrane region domain-containing protein n=1 Tax=Trifolium subterraneum TaxID=3900 RepID=A0A2Z6MQI9_TRISU|nr:hypothetical protein TSUD_161380 [Trifolium subterraneum]